MRIRKPVQNGNITASNSAFCHRAAARLIASAMGSPTSRQISVETPATRRLRSSASRYSGSVATSIRLSSVDADRV